MLMVNSMSMENPYGCEYHYAIVNIYVLVNILEKIFAKGSKIAHFLKEEKEEKRRKEMNLMPRWHYFFHNAISIDYITSNM